MSLAEIKRQFVGELRADRRKAVLVAVLTVAVLVLGIRLVLKRSSADGGTPAAASAAASVPQRSPVIRQAPPGDKTGSGDKSTRERAEYVRNLDRSMVRDIFEPNPVFFPLDGQGGLEDPSRKAARDAAEAQANYEKFIREQATSLKLQSTMVGSAPSAVINDRVVRVGDLINGFEVLRITSQSCVLGKEGVEVSLKMKR